MKNTEVSSTALSIRRYLSLPIDVWCFPRQELICYYPGFSDPELAWFRSPIPNQEKR